MSIKIRLDNVGKTFPAKAARDGEARPFVALENITLDVRTGEFLAIVGPSGCGKSSLLDMIGGLSKPSSGQILLDGKPITGAALDRGIVFQQYALFPWRSALDNVAFALEARGMPRAQRFEIAREHLALVGLSEFEDRLPHELSGGMRQRVAIARSLAHDPAVLLMDEPFAALDAQTRETLQDELLRIWERSGKTIVFITHGLDEAVYLGQRVVVITSRPGRVKAIVDIPLSDRTNVEDLRSSPSFGALRHEVWRLIKDEVGKAQALELH